MVQWWAFRHGCVASPILRMLLSLQLSIRVPVVVAVVFWLLAWLISCPCFYVGGRDVMGKHSINTINNNINPSPIKTSPVFIVHTSALLKGSAEWGWRPTWCFCCCCCCWWWWWWWWCLTKWCLHGHGQKFRVILLMTHLAIAIAGPHSNAVLLSLCHDYHYHCRIVFRL